MHTRQQNYMFAYDIVPAFLFRSDFARIIAAAHPRGFLYFQEYWERMASIFPAEQVVSDEKLATQAFQIADGVYSLVVRMPPAERYLEVQYLGIVFLPKLRYFVAGLSSVGGSGHGSDRWTLREVTTEGHGRCGMLLENTPEHFAEQIGAAMDVSSNIRAAKDEEIVQIAERIQTFPAEFQHTPPEAVLTIGAVYRVLSLINGDTSGIPASAVAQIYEESSDSLRPIVEAILSDPDGFTADSLKTPKRWWQFWK